jgi:hypothetical protein
MEAQGKAAGPREQMFAGAAILLVGLIALGAELFADFGRFAPLLVGVALLGLFIYSRNYLALIGGCIVTGVGAGVALSYLLGMTGEAEGGATTLGLGLGFISIWAISLLVGLREHHWWPLVPGAILSVVGVNLLFNTLAQPLVGPLILVGIGVALMGYAMSRSRTSHKPS